MVAGGLRRHAWRRRRLFQLACPLRVLRLLAPTSIIRLHLGELAWPRSGERFPVHGFLVVHPDGAGLVDTGFGTGPDFLKDWRAVNRPVADALVEHGLSPADIRWVINTHLHWDHCGQNAVFKHAPLYVQRTEYERARRPNYTVMEWLDFAGARFELLDGEQEIVPGVRVVTTPGHTGGHQSVQVDTTAGKAILVGDAAYNIDIFEGAEPPKGAAEDLPAYRASLAKLMAAAPTSVHFCHDRRVWSERLRMNSS